LIAKNKIFTSNSGIEVFEHNDVNEKNEKTTKYLCGHVFRIITEIKHKYNVKISGFIHIPLNSLEKDFFEILGLFIYICYKSLNKKETNIMITGFTKFNGVPDNPTSRFLFDDGKSENYGLINANINKINDVINNLFGKNIKYEIIYKNFNQIKKDIGISYSYKNSIINLTFVRLPVDDDLTNEEEKEVILNKGTIYESKVINYPGDYTGFILKNSISIINPDIILSFGVSKKLEIKEYHIENQAYGMTEKGALYNTKEDFIINNDLSNLLKNYYSIF